MVREVISLCTPLNLARKKVVLGKIADSIDRGTVEEWLYTYVDRQKRTEPGSDKGTKKDYILEAP